MIGSVRTRLTLLAITTAVWVFSGVPGSASGRPPAEDDGAGYLATLLASGEDHPSIVPPPWGAGVSAEQAAVPATSDIVVSYEGFPADAQAAFEYAVRVWETWISSPVPIRIEAAWVSMGEGVLGTAGPAVTPSGFDGAAPGTRYPSALANAIAGVDLRPARDDIDAYFNSSFPSWYFGTDGNPPPGAYDFATVVLHEIGHGLGFTGSATVSSQGGTFGSTPHIWDRFLETGDGSSLVDTLAPGDELAGALQSNDLWFGGPAATAAGGGVRPRIHAPNPWEPGSSGHHLSDAAFASGQADSLMTTRISAREVVHNPGPVTVAILADLGWPGLAPAAALAFSPGPPAVAYGGVAITPPIVVEVRTAAGAVVTGDSSTIISLAFDGTTASLFCAGGSTRQVDSGRAVFDDCAATGSGTGLRLIATSAPPRDAALSPPFELQPAASYRTLVPALGRDGP